MSAKEKIGLSCALVTPFSAAGEVAVAPLVRHAHRLIGAGCDSVTVFGTTGEGPMAGAREREPVYAAFAAAGFDMRRQVIGGVITNAANEAAAQMLTIYRHGCRAVLLAPPFYFPEPGEDGVFDWYASVFRAVGAAARDVILYHIPQFTGVHLTIPLVMRLAKAFPGVVIGVKDSLGLREQTLARVRAHGDLQILVGNEADVALAVRLGGAGTICGFANFIAGDLRAVAHDGRDSEAIARLAEVIEGVHFLAAFKVLMAHIHGEPEWLNIRPPLSRLVAADASKLIARWSKAFAGKAA